MVNRGVIVEESYMKSRSDKKGLRFFELYLVFHLKVWQDSLIGKVSVIQSFLGPIHISAL